MSEAKKETAAVELNNIATKMNESISAKPEPTTAPESVTPEEFDYEQWKVERDKEWEEVLASRRKEWDKYFVMYKAEVEEINKQYDDGKLKFREWAHKLYDVHSNADVMRRELLDL